MVQGDVANSVIPCAIVVRDWSSFWSVRSGYENQKTRQCQHLQGDKGIFGLNQASGPELRWGNPRAGHVLEREAGGRGEKVTPT